MIAPTAIIHPSAKIDKSVEIGAFCVIGENVTLEKHVKLHSHVVIEAHTNIGENTVVHPFAVLGGAPQSTGYKGEPTTLVVGKNNIIREGVTFNRGTINDRGETRIGDNNFFMAYSHVAHDGIVGNNCIFANNASLGGHCVVGNFIFIGGFATVHQFTRIGDYAMVSQSSAVRKDIIPYATAAGAENDGAKIIGLNVVGLKRRGFTKQEIADIYACYKAVFSGEKPFKERLEEALPRFQNTPKADAIINFLNTKEKREIMQTRKRGEA